MCESTNYKLIRIKPDTLMLKNRGKQLIRGFNATKMEPTRNTF